MRGEFAKKLREIRIQEGCTIKQFSELLSVPEGTYKAWEYGLALPNYANRDMLVKEYPELNLLWEREKLLK